MRAKLIINQCMDINTHLAIWKLSTRPAFIVPMFLKVSNLSRAPINSHLFQFVPFHSVPFREIVGPVSGVKVNSAHFPLTFSRVIQWNGHRIRFVSALLH